MSALRDSAAELRLVSGELRQSVVTGTIILPDSGQSDLRQVAWKSAGGETNHKCRLVNFINSFSQSLL